MVNEREQIAEGILELLGGSPAPLTAREITSALNNSGVGATKAVVNSVLYNELSSAGGVIQVRGYRWLANAGRPGPGRSREATPRAQDVSGASAVLTSAPEQRRTARRVLQVLRSGTTSLRAAKAISVGTAAIERELVSRLEALFKGGAGDEIVLIAADWGFGKSHVRMLLSGHLSEWGIPFAHECIDGRGASLSHIHRVVPRWLEGMQIGRTVGLRNALNNGTLPAEWALKWAANHHSDFTCGIRAGLGGWEWGWLQALGHLYRSPDYSYQHPKAWTLLKSAAAFLNGIGRGGLVLLLDEAENIDKQYDIRGRRKSYETLARMTRHPQILPVLFVTDRFHYQVREDYEHGVGGGWSNWSSDAKWFVSRFRELQPLSPPALNGRLAEELVMAIEALYRCAYPLQSGELVRQILEHWRRTPTRSIRLLVRLTVNELDLRRYFQNGAMLAGGT